MITIKNNNLIINISEKGAELDKIYSKDTNIDYLWSGDKNWWSEKSPLLFPIVGGSKCFNVNKNPYSIPKHGFAKDLDFEGTQISSTICEFSLVFNEGTLKIYPYKFQLIVRYELMNSSLKITFKTINLDTKEIFYSVGGHPGFSLNLLDGDSISDYYLEFSKNKNLVSKYKIRKDTLAEPYHKKIGIQTIYNLEDKFIDDALIFQNLKSTKVKLLSSKHPHGLELDFNEFEYLGLWAKVGAPYICIEPWNGINDLVGFSGDISKKQGIRRLKQNETESFSYTIAFF